MVKYTLLKSLLIIGLFFALTFQAQATHIVGGSLSYRCLGNSFYELNLTVYTDCALGQADYDKPAWIGVFNTTTGMITDTIFMEFSNKIDTLEQTDPCFISLPDICYRVSTYRKIVSLPYLEDGYTITYQRCCRNESIVNIFDPVQAGATYFVEITKEAQDNCYSSPVFTNDPPIFICVNQPYTFDHSAFATNGDSLVYELITPYVGGVYNINPQPRPPFGPPYENVEWIDPPYNVNNMLNFTPGMPGDSLKINPATGLMTAVPNTIGQFVVGVRVKEYLAGMLINETFRDFQYNVVPCEVTNAEINLDKFAYCDEFLVQFDNASFGAEAYFWDFGDPSTTEDTSSLFAPFYVYPDTGTYTVTLVAKLGDVCSDTAFATITVQLNSIDICLDLVVPDCSAPIVLQWEDCSTDPISPIEKWDLSLTTPSGTQLFNTPNGEIIFNQSTDVYLKYIVESANGCIDSLLDTLKLQVIDPIDLVPDTLNQCYAEVAYPNPNFNPNLVYFWSPDTFLIDDRNQPNPGIQATKTTTYFVNVSDSSGLCTVVDSVEIVVVDDLPDLDIEILIPECTDSIRIDAKMSSYPPDITISWEVTTSTDVLIFNTPSIDFILTESQQVIICAVISSDSCSTIVCDTIQANLISNPNLPDTLAICQGDSVELYPGAPIEQVYLWLPPDYLDDNTKGNPISTPINSILYTLTLTDTVGLCIIKDSVFVEVNDSSKILDYSWDILCDGLTVDFINQSENINQYYWDFGDPSSSGDNSTEENPTWIYPGPGTYTVFLTSPDEGVCPQVDTVFKDIVLEEPINEANFTYKFVQCGFPTEIQFFGAEFSTYGNVTQWFWDFGALGNSDLQNPTLIVTESQTIIVSLTVVWDDLCVDTISQEIEVEIFDLNIMDTFEICFDSCVQVSHDGDVTWFYEWSPEAWMDDPNAAFPVICPTESGFASVSIIALQPGGDTCFLADTIYFSMNECDFDCDLVPDDLISCLDSLKYTIEDCDGMLALIWCSPFGDTLALGNMVSIPMRDFEFIVLKKIGPFGYMEIDTIFLEFLEYDIPITAASDPYTIFSGSASQLTAFTTFPVISYSWTPPETLNNPFIFNPVASPSDTTIYTIIVTDEYGCTGADTTIVHTLTPGCTDPYIFVPNTFTPNGDNNNDVLFVRGNYIDVLEFYVYNRWGEKVFESRNKNDGWDGTYKGEPLGTDVYGYYLKALCLGGEEFFKKGNVTLLRN